MTNNCDELYKRLFEAQKAIKKAAPSEKYALINYIYNLIDAISTVSKVSFNKKKNQSLLDQKDRKKFVETAYMYNAEFVDNFIRHMRFHETFLESILQINYDSKIPSTTKNYQQLSASDFKELLFDFFKSLKLERFLTKYFEKNSVFDVRRKVNNQPGTIINNPLNKESNIILENFTSNLYFINILCHELGHAYDLEMFKENTEAYNKYFNQSLYSEVISILFEILLIRYLNMQSIMVEETKALLADFECNHNEFILSAFILSLVDEDFFGKSQCENLTPNQVYLQVKDQFENPKSIQRFLMERGNVNLYESLIYSYGSIIATVLSHEMDDRLDTERLKSFMAERHKMFSPDFLENIGVTTDSYEKAYRKIKTLY